MTLIKKKSALSVALVAAFAIGPAGTAQADALATSILELNNLEFQDPGTGLILQNGLNIQVIGFTQNANVSADLGGAPLSVSVPSGVNVDIPIQCVGNCADPRLVNNGFNIFSTAVADPSSKFAASDQLEIGAPVANVPDGLGGIFATPATVSAGSVVSLDGAGAGSADANNGIVAQVVFQVTSNLAVDIAFDASAYLEAFVTPGGFGEVAQASYDTTFELFQNVGGLQQLVFRWTPDGILGSGIVGGTETLDPFSLNSTVASIDPLGGPAALGAALGTANVGAFLATTPVLTQGAVYTLNARMGTRADAVAPEPTGLALLGAGLIGMGFAARRRRNSRKT